MKRMKIGLLPRLLLGILVGILIGQSGTLLGIHDTEGFTLIVRLLATFNSLFSTFLSFLIPLLIVSFVAAGMAELGKKASKLFGITLILAYVSTVLAGLCAFALGKAVLPSVIKPISRNVVESSSYEPLFTITADPVFGVMTALILAFLLGLGMSRLKSNSLLDCVRDLRQIITMTLNHIIIPLIPIHICGLFCNIAASGSLAATIRMFLMLFVFILVTQWLYLGVQFGISSLYCRENNYKKVPKIIPAYFTAVGTQSSASTIPISLRCNKNAGVKEDISDFCIPLCATIHLSGDTICLVIGTMGIMLANGIVPTFATYMPFILMLGVTMVAAPGVPGGGVMAAIGIIESMLGFNEAMQSLIISLHLSQDSFGTATNVTGDQALSMIVNTYDQRTEARRNKQNG